MASARLFYIKNLSNFPSVVFWNQSFLSNVSINRFEFLRLGQSIDAENLLAVLILEYGLVVLFRSCNLLNKDNSKTD